MAGTTGHIDEQKLADEYGDPDLARAVYADAVRLGNLRKIRAGEMFWPDADGARRWRDRLAHERLQEELSRKKKEEEEKPLPGEPGYTEG